MRNYSKPLTARTIMQEKLKVREISAAVPEERLVNVGGHTAGSAFELVSWSQGEVRHNLQKSAGKDGVITMPISGGAVSWEEGGASRGVGHFILGDARQVTGEQILGFLGMERGEVDCVFGGPPCQGFSRMGRRQVMDPRNSLLFEFARLTCEIAPKTIMMENVPDVATMVTPEGVPVLDAYTMILEEGGMGTLEALRRSLLANAGTGAMVRGKPVPAKRPGKREREKIQRAAHAPAATQTSLPMVDGVR